MSDPCEPNFCTCPTCDRIRRTRESILAECHALAKAQNPSLALGTLFWAAMVFAQETDMPISRYVRIFGECLGRMVGRDLVIGLHVLDDPDDDRPSEAGGGPDAAPDPDPREGRPWLDA